MRTSLRKVKEIESFLLKSGEPGDRVLFEAKLQLDPELAEEVYWQEQTYRVIRARGRERLREELEALQHKLFSNPEYRSFQQKIFSFFKR